ncbi:unnamed protein product, partial [Polarella glacialis]
VDPQVPGALQPPAPAVNGPAPPCAPQLGQPASFAPAGQAVGANFWDEESPATPSYSGAGSAMSSSSPAPSPAPAMRQPPLGLHLEAAFKTKESWRSFMEPRAAVAENEVYRVAKYWQGKCMVCLSDMRGLSEHMLSEKHYKKLGSQINWKVPEPKVASDWSRQWVDRITLPRGVFLFNYITGESGYEADLLGSGTQPSQAPVAAAAPPAQPVPVSPPVPVSGGCLSRLADDRGLARSGGRPLFVE